MGRRKGGREGLIVPKLPFIPVQCRASKLTGDQKPWNGETSDLLSMVRLMPVVCQTGFMDSVVQVS